MSSISVQQLIDGLYIAFYNRAADEPGYTYWENQVTLTQSQAVTTTLTHQDYQYATPLGQQFFSSQSTYFNSQYSPLNDSAFINQVYINFGGSAADTNGLNYWVNMLANQSRQQVALQISQDFLTIDLTLSTNLSPAELAAAQARQQTFLNKVAVSESFSAASANHPFLVAASASSADPAFNAAIAIVQGVTAAASTVTSAQALIAAAVAAGNVTPITLRNTPPAAVTLTLGTNTITGSGVGSDVITAPVLFNAATGTDATTLHAGDSISESGANNTLNLTVGASDSTISGVAVSGVQTFNVTNTGSDGTQPVIGGAGITGLTTVTNLNSTQTVGVGSAASPLTAALTTVGVTGTPANPNTTGTIAMIAATALAGTSDALAVNASNAGTAGAPARVLVGPATGVNGYETVAVAATGTNFIGLGNPVSGENTTASVVVTGAGSISLFGDGSANDFTSLATIDASAATGNVTVTGAATPGAGVGLLTGDTAVRSVLGGSGADVVDLSSMTLAQYNANGTTVDLGAGRNTLIVDDTVATTADPLARTSNVAILGDLNPGASAGTVDFAKLPAGIDTFKLFGTQGANPIVLANGPGTLTFDAGTFGTSFAQTTIAAAGTGTGDVLNLIEGSATAGNANNEAYVVTGYETIDIDSEGGKNTLFQLMASASPGSTVTLNIGGNADLTFLAPANGPAITGASAMTITNSALTVLGSTVNTGSTDARTVNAAASGGLIMGGAETGNIGVDGAVIVGSAVAGKSNILIGSKGNDTLAGGTGSDVLVTDGGGDTITLGTHVSDRIEVYGVNNSQTDQTLGAVQGAQAGSIVNTMDQASGGYWGTVPGATPVNIFTLFPGMTAATFGTSADQSVVGGFLVGDTGDKLDFSLRSFAAPSGSHRGLSAVDGTTAASLGTANMTTVAANGVLSGTASDVVVLTGSTFSGAADLAQALKTGTFALDLSSTPTAGNVAHMLFAYDDGAGNGHIADVAINETASTSFAAQTNVAAQDLVQLTGVSVGSLTSSNIQFVA